MEYERRQYLDELTRKKDNGRVKVITGLRRCGKSYLLFNLFYNRLLESGVQEDQIITLALDEIDNARYRNPFELNSYVKERIKDRKRRYYVFLDEIQFVLTVPNPYVDDPEAKLTFIDVVLGLMKIPNVDVYVTGSNSKMLSSDILTQFRDRADEIRVYPLSFAEFYEHCWRPLILTKKCSPKSTNLEFTDFNRCRKAADESFFNDSGIIRIA